MVKPKTPTMTQKYQIYFTYLLLKRKKEIRLTIFLLRKNQRSPKISSFIMICLLQLRLFLLPLPLAHAHIHERERERERERDEKQKVRW